MRLRNLIVKIKKQIKKKPVLTNQKICVGCDNTEVVHCQGTMCHKCWLEETSDE